MRTRDPFIGGKKSFILKENVQGGRGMKKVLSHILTAAIAVVLSVPISTYFATRHVANSLPAMTQPAETKAAGAGWNPLTSSATPDQITNIVQHYRDAVVHIDAYSDTGASNPLFDDFFRQFFNLPILPQQQAQHAIGTGFVFDKNGYILTNDHVIQGADRIDVKFPDSQKTIPANVIGADYDLDLAVLKVSLPKDIPVLPLGSSNAAPVGEWVIAIGNPLGFDSTVTVGVLSAKGRDITIGNRHYQDLLQTDAAINPGNSGGPLLDLRGDVIGINTAVSENSQGIGFAIPIDEVKQVLNQLIKNGKIPHPFVGVYIENITPDIAQYFGLGGVQGAIITEVTPGSPAAVAGLQPGDVIEEINHVKMRSAQDVVSAIKSFQVGQEVTFLILRNHQTLTVPVKLSDEPPQMQQ
jgi:serine protease Do